MKKNIVIVFSLIIIIGIMTAVLVFMKTDEPKINYTKDEIKFKEEYESLNGVELNQDYILKTIDIDSDNNIKYVKDNELIDLLSNDTNVIYFGWADCNWCRSIIPTLIETVKENNIDNLYYYDLKALRTAYENDTDDKKVKLYKDVLDIIGEDITSVFAEDSLKSGEKKILAPTVVFIKNGEYLGLHIKSVDSQLNSTDELTDAQIKELKSKYKAYLEQLSVNVCTTDEGC